MDFLDMTDDDIDNLLLGVDINKEIEIVEKNCISCNSDNLVIDENNGYNVCQNCGVINKTYLDKNAGYNKDENCSSYGCPTNYFFPKSAMGTKINFKGYNKIGLLQRQGQMPYKEKSLMDELIKIQAKCKEYSITQNIIDTAKILYKKISDSKHTKGERKGKNRIMRCINRKSMIAACVFYACKVQGEPRSPKEIADIYSLDIKHVNRGYRKFMDYIDINELFTEFKSSQSSDFIRRFSNKLNMNKENIKFALDIAENIKKLDLASTHEPPSVAAGCILLVINIKKLNINRKEISQIFKISDVTISKTYRRIYPYRKIICNNEITDLILKEKFKQVVHKKVITKENLVKV
jgi:transcription initiation factor TFIIIB Brf1 subunit/transcription initiation factor TFIIB